MRCPAQKRNSTAMYESMVDNVQNPSIFVLSAGTDEHVYPDYLIKFKGINS
jgi:hypothetical protein